MGRDNARLKGNAKLLQYLHRGLQVLEVALAAHDDGYPGRRIAPRLLRHRFYLFLLRQTALHPGSSTHIRLGILSTPLLRPRLNAATQSPVKTRPNQDPLRLSAVRCNSSARGLAFGSTPVVHERK